ncbi:DUF6415 family natural product biosynthesis protein [Streptomyces sp. NPDC058678]|uniref:DUF6415 family natural product biosynthesis protein n=1 Tax=Streptomyces sp. NPDC058678 TaxID=3346595 RepID=UPI00365C96DB
MNQTVTAGTVAPPVNIDTMRHTISQLMDSHVQLPGGEALDLVQQALRGHIQLIIPEVEQAAWQRDKEDVSRYCALACVGEARGKLRAANRPGEHGALAYARRLARTLAALCDHHEALAGAVMCLACDQPLRDGEDTLAYDHVSPSGSALRAGRIYTRCAHMIRRH